MDSGRSNGSGKNKIHPEVEDKGTKMKYLIDTDKKSGRIMKTEEDETGD
jgi:hypothetical protein